MHTIRVSTVGHDSRGADLLQEIRATLGITGLQTIQTRKVYRLEGISQEQAQRLAERILCDPLTQVFAIEDGRPQEAGGRCVEVAYKPGVMNPEAASLLKAAHDSGVPELLAADTGWEYQFGGELSEGEVELIVNRLLVNKTVEQVVIQPPTTLLINYPAGAVQVVSLTTLSDEALVEVSQGRCLFLNLEEMRVIQEEFRQLGREPTDAELETLAQTWSEHCGHKTFKARLIVDGQEKLPLMTRIKETATKYFGDKVLSAFVDNSGVIEFFDGHAVCGKVETHNSPSAIEPYGGAMTGSGGVFRDVMGTGQGAKVIVSTDMFCFAPPDLPVDQLPSGCLHPRYLLRKVVAGVRDYGNRMGIPTNNGSVHFHQDFRAKPTVIVGAYGIMPADTCQKGEPRDADVIIAVGGRTGRDGIHGATFSSGEMTAQTISVNASAVQIGNAIEEKRVTDALLACRDAGLLRAITDCGAGGFASAIGEMGSTTGVRVMLEKVPLKYLGLAPWEIWLSESQERMVLAAAPEFAERVLEICSAHNVEATVLGVFTNDQRLVVTYHGVSVCDLTMQFLHDGLPQRVMTAWEPAARPVASAAVPEPETPEVWMRVYQAVLAHGNVCSKEPIVRMYDHSVQGTSALPPFSGAQHDGPNDAAVIRPLLDQPYGLIVAHGLNPVLNRLDPYAGSLWAAVEALANYVAVGGDFREAALIDNFIWPFPDEESLWDLDRAVDACCAVMEAFKLPFVSGKDSLSSTYRRGDFVLKIPPVLCVSVFGKISDVTKTVTADFKHAGSHIVLVGKPDVTAMGGSVYYDIHGQSGGRVPQVDLQGLPKLFDWLHVHLGNGDILACHDISEGGLAAALAEMCFGGSRGAMIDIPDGWEDRLDEILFNETAGCFLLEVDNDQLPYLQNASLTDQIPCAVIGQVVLRQTIAVYRNDEPLFTLPLDQLKSAWQQPMKEVFH